MGDLQITVGDLHFSARWDPDAPLTQEAIRRMLPIERQLIHCRWTGESTWIPFGDFRPGLDWENHTSHPAPGVLAIYPGGISECEIFFPYGDIRPVRAGRGHDGPAADHQACHCLAPRLTRPTRTASSPRAGRPSVG